MSSRLPQPLKQAIREALADMGGDAQGRKILGSWGIEALRPVGLRDYEATRGMMRAAAAAAQA